MNRPKELRGKQEPSAAPPLGAKPEAGKKSAIPAIVPIGSGGRKGNGLALHARFGLKSSSSQRKFLGWPAHSGRKVGVADFLASTVKKNFGWAPESH